MRVVSFGFSWKCPDLAYVIVKDTNTCIYINVASPCSLGLGPHPCHHPSSSPRLLYIIKILCPMCLDGSFLEILQKGSNDF